jgi:hypothetical protein
LLQTQEDELMEIQKANEENEEKANNEEKDNNENVDCKS